MAFNRRTLVGLAALVAAAAPALKAAARPAGQTADQTSDQTAPLAPPDPTEEFRLWPGGAPGGEKVTVVGAVTERSTDPAYHDRFAQFTTDPILSVVRPEHPNGSALLLIPGGGYRWSVVDKEGLDCARVFAAAGVTCYVLRYRLPADGWAAGPDAPLQDAQRALRMIRARVDQDGVDPKRVGVLGASAGGHLAGLLTVRKDTTYAAIDEIDKQSHRPDLTILMYPVATMADPFVHAGSRQHLLGAAPSAEMIAAWSLEQMDWTGAPPTFLLHAIDDQSVPVENSLQLLAAIRKANVPTEAHLFQEGGHGFGIRLIQGKPAAAWPELALAWARRHAWAA